MKIRSRVIVATILLVTPLCYITSQGNAQHSPEDAVKNIGNKGKNSAQMQKFKKTMTTIFWVGEGASGDNGFIHNYASYWDVNWMKHFGGVDNPLKRKGYMPAAFTPKQNPFYVALPFAEVDTQGHVKEITKKIPGYGTNQPLTKNRWVEIRYNGKSCFGQWQDVGPFGEDDFDWVFGSATKPKNTQGLKAGLDVSPAVAEFLGLKDSDKTEWRFVDEQSMPNGPWHEIVTR